MESFNPKRRESVHILNPNAEPFFPGTKKSVSILSRMTDPFYTRTQHNSTTLSNHLNEPTPLGGSEISTP